jgi:hypothetical protein
MDNRLALARNNRAFLIKKIGSRFEKRVRKMAPQVGDPTSGEPDLI